MGTTRELTSVIYEKDGPIARIILNNPDKANAQTSSLVWDVDDCLTDASRDYDIKVVVLKASGKGFSSGHVIGMDLRKANPEYAESSARTGTTWKAQQDLFVEPVLRLWEFPKP